jgi:transcription elongation factor GreA
MRLPLDSTHMPDLPEELRTRTPRAPGQEATANLTLDAYQRLKAELEQLTTVGRTEITDKIRVAREHGDLKENAEYHAAKDEQGMMESRIRKIQHMLRDPDIVEAPEHADEVGPGMLVTVKPLDFDEEDDETYLIAEHAEEKAPGARTVTIGSPFGSALVGTAVGDEVAYDAPGGTFRYRIVAFEPFTG